MSDQLAILDDAGAINPDALVGAEQAIENADDWWRSCAEAAVRNLARTGRDFTADDVRALGMSEPDHPNRWGGLFRWAARAGLVEEAGARRSSTVSRKASLVRVWRGTALARTGGAA